MTGTEHTPDPSEGVRAPRLVRSVAAPTALIVFAAGMLAWSSIYNETARQVPMLVAGIMLVLAMIDFACRFDAAGMRAVRDFWGADFANREMRHNPRVGAEVRQCAWMTVCVAAMLVIGILPAVPLFVFAYMAFNGRRPVGESAVAAVVVFAFVFVVFELLLEYRLYRGVLFDPRGFAGW